MSVSIHIPTALRGYTGGQAAVQVEAATVAEALDRLTTDHAALQKQIRDASGKLRSFVNVYLNDEDIRFLDDKDDTALSPGDSLTIVPSIAGGAA